ncbi:MAG: hypothetical protein ACTHJ8_14275, partial [Mucilaginibacter sp.]
MQRRHFIRLSATAGAAVLFNRLTSIAASIQPVINLPEEVWAKSGDEWHKLEHSGSAYAYKDIRVRLRADETALSVYVSSPSAELNAVRLKWQHGLPANAKVLGDHWERSYGDLGWKQPNSNTKQPWYFLLHDGKDTACFGVKTGCNAICWWNLTDKTIELTMDTSSGGVGVLLGNRELHAADIVTTTSTAQ